MNKFLRLLGPTTALALTLGLPSSLQAHGTEAHGNHDPHHGGAVMMHQTLHYEVVLPPGGGVQIYYTDAVRGELPASVVTDVAVEIDRPGSKTEAVEMAIGPTGEFWQGKSKPVQEPKAVVRVAFVFQGEPVLVNLPASYWPAPDKSAHEAGHHEH